MTPLFDASHIRRKYPLMQERFISSLDMYVNNGVRPGDFMQAALSNQFISAVGRADSGTLAIIHIIAQVIYNELPSEAWGSRLAVEAWLTTAKDRRKQADV